MPYKYFQRGEQFCVYKVDENKQPVGKTLGCHNTADEASKQISAIIINEGKQSLAHYGILGMRWGVRRSRGSAGSVSEALRSASRGKPSSDYSESRKLLKKHSSQLSNEQIRKLNKRLEMERKLNSLDPTAIGSGKRAVNQFMNNYGNGVIGGLAGAAAVATVSKILRKQG